MILKFERRSYDNYFNALKWLAKYSNLVKTELITNGFTDVSIIFENYIIGKLKKYQRLADLLALGSLLNLNIVIDEIIDESSCFHFLIENGKKKVKRNIRQHC